MERWSKHNTAGFAEYFSVDILLRGVLPAMFQIARLCVRVMKGVPESMNILIHCTCQLPDQDVS
jgi:hypothetical protein